MEGEWAGELSQAQLSVRVAEALACDPGVLVTHAPPTGVLDSDEGDGIDALAVHLGQASGRLRAHFFGHVHARAGESLERNGVRFFNGACGARVRELDLT